MFGEESWLFFHRSLQVWDIEFGRGEVPRVRCDVHRR